VTRLMIGIFGHAADATLAIEGLKESGIKAKHISVVTKQKNVVDQISHDTGIGKTDAGLGNSGIFGTARGLGIGLDMLPDTAVAAGPAARKLAGAELDSEDSKADGMAVSFIGLGIPKEAAEAYASHADKEHIVVIVMLKDAGEERVNALFSEHHAISLESQP